MNKKKFSFLQTKKMIPSLKEFNSVAKIFLKLLNKKIERKEKRLANIAVLVKDMAIPEKKYSINIQTIDIRDTKIRKKGSGSITKTMDWEKNLDNRRKGIIL